MYFSFVQYRHSFNSCAAKPSPFQTNPSPVGKHIIYNAQQKMKQSKRKRASFILPLAHLGINHYFGQEGAEILTLKPLGKGHRNND